MWESLTHRVYYWMVCPFFRGMIIHHEMRRRSWFTFLVDDNTWIMSSEMISLVEWKQRSCTMKWREMTWWLFHELLIGSSHTHTLQGTMGFIHKKSVFLQGSSSWKSVESEWIAWRQLALWRFPLLEWSNQRCRWRWWCHKTRNDRFHWWIG